jgi:RNA polymerase nonessential primary-like sigma factor
VHVVRELQQVLRARRTLENDPAFQARVPGRRRWRAGRGRRRLLGRDVQEVADLLALSETPRSLDASVARTEDGTRWATPSPTNWRSIPPASRRTTRSSGLLDNWIHTLSMPRKEVLEGRFGLHDREPETLEVLSERLGLTRERVRQIQNEALTIGG